MIFGFGKSELDKYFFMLPSYCNILIILLSFIQSVNTCREKEPMLDDVLIASSGYQSADQVKLKSSGFSGLKKTEPFRIHVHYENNYITQVSRNIRVTKDVIVPKVVAMFEDLLQVQKPANRFLKLGRQCYRSHARHHDYGFGNCIYGCKPVEMCGDAIEIPREHLLPCSYGTNTSIGSNRTTPKPDIESTGVDAHFILYLTFKQTFDCDESTLAYASTCRLGTEELGNRPTAGYMNICPKYLEQWFDVNDMEYTIVHELIHALAFSTYLYPFYRDHHGNPRSTRDNNGYPLSDGNKYITDETTIKKITRKWWTANGYVNHTVKMLVTSRVVRAVREHFQCWELEGAELEGQGYSGRESALAHNHLEMRAFKDEVMTPAQTPVPSLSRITLALLEDSGWYLPNYKYAEHLGWGNGLGCDFAMKSCGEWMKIQRFRDESNYPYCDDYTVDKLNGDVLDYAPRGTCCYVSEREQVLPESYQNFQFLSGVSEQNLRFYGGLSYADFCPVAEGICNERPDRRTGQKHSTRIRSTTVTSASEAPEVAPRKVPIDRKFVAPLCSSADILGVSFVMLLLLKNLCLF